ncbi:MAG: thioesterase [Gammaproteobacteria bacterium]|nr:thioesterase [Gammaproteobacteria bacterium]|tara:strand:+ start:8896 stop:9333 length:438 start_codon:yes stop_codon:yes gene_type:complete
MKLLAELRAQGRGRDMAAVLAHIPYARFLGIDVDVKGNEVTTILPFKEDLVGNVNLPALHGGVIGALLEITAVTQLLFDTSCERLPKTIDLSVDYLRSGRPQPTYGRAIVTRHGRRVANVRSEIWQEERSRPIGVSHGHFLLAPL